MSQAGRVVAATLALLVYISASSFALGRMSGVVKDSAGNPIAGASITFKNQTTGAKQALKSGSDGRYVITTLAYGRWEVTVEAEGFPPRTDEFTWAAEVSPLEHDFNLSKAVAATGGQQVPVEGLTSELARALDDANEAIAAEDWAKAITIYEGARATSGDHPLLVMGLAKAYLKQNDTAKAEVALQAALKLSPVPAGAHFYLGNILAGKGKKEDARHEFEQETQLSPQNERAFYNLGALSYDMGKKAEAVAALEKARGINPDNPDTQKLLAKLYAETGQADKAQAAADGAAKSGGATDVTSVLNAGIKLYNDHKDKEALDSFQQAVTLDPKSAKGHRMLGLTYLRLGQFDKAKDAFRKALELDPKDEESKSMLKELGG